MTIQSPFAKRIAGVFATRVVRFAIGFVTSFVLSRILGPAGRGAFALATLTPTTLTTLGQLGLPSSFSFFAGRGRSGAKLQWLGIVFSAILSVVLIGATLLALPWLEQNVLKAAPGDLVRLALISIPFQFLAAFAGSTLIGRQTLRNYNLILVGQSILMLLLAILLVGVLRLGVAGAIVATIVVAVAMALATVLELRRSISRDPQEPEREGAGIGELVSFGAKIYPASLAGFFGYRADVFLLSAILADPRALGLYSLGVSLAELTFFVPDSVSTVFFPRVASSERRSADEMVVNVCRFTVLITLLSVVGLVPAAFVAVHVLLPDFVDSLSAFLILMPGVVALTVAKVLSSYVSGLGVPLQVAMASGTALVVNVIANLLLIPLFGILGAALASLISYSVNAGMLLSIAARLSRRGPFDFLLPTGAEWRRLLSGLREVYALLRRSPQAEEH